MEDGAEQKQTGDEIVERRRVRGENRDGMAPAKLLTFSFSLSVRTFPGLNSGDPDTLPLSPWKHLDIPYHLPTKTWANMKKKSFQYVGHDLSIQKCHMINPKCQNINCCVFVFDRVLCVHVCAR